MKLTLELKVTLPAPVGQGRKGRKRERERDKGIKASSCKLTFGIFQFRITVNSCIAHIAISGVKYVGQLSSLEWPWNPSNEDGLPSIYGLGVIHDEVTIRELPWPDLNLQRLVCHQHTILQLHQPTV